MSPLSWQRPRHYEGMRKGETGYRRTLKHKGKRVEPEQILKWINTRYWDYSWNVEFYHLRDKALISLIYLLCGRIGEILSLKKQQFVDQKDFLIVKEFVVEKNKVNPIRDDWGLPKKGTLAPFTKIVMDYLKSLPKKQTNIFNIKRQRAWQIVNHITGKWCHYFRAMGEAYYMRRVFKDPVRCAVALRLRRSDTLIEYVPFEWRDYTDQLSA